MNIIQVVGYKKSGKTTLSSRMIELASAHGYRTGSCKHHGHGTPDVLDGTDSRRHQKAGAVISGVEGGGTLNLSIPDVHWDLKRILAFYKLVETDLIIIEGFKKESYPKVVLIRNEEDLSLLQELTNVIAVVYEHHTRLKAKKEIKYFSSYDDEEFESWYINYINKLMENR